MVAVPLDHGSGLKRRQGKGSQVWRLAVSAVDTIEPLAVSITEACQRLGVGETTLRALLDDGRLPFSRIPGANPKGRGRVLIRVSDLDKLLTATAVAVTPRARARRPEGHVMRGGPHDD
jgi:excisionase family DNA binding protein